MFPLTILKGSLFMFMTLFLNSLNGYSGLAAIDFLYFALYCVNSTTLLPILIFIGSSPYTYDFDKLGPEIIKADPTKLQNYNPNNKSWYDYLIDIRFINKTDYMIEKGISTNKDESTNNLSHYCWYCRDSLCNNLYNKYKLYMVWALLGGIMQIQICQYCLNNIINVDGITADYWYCGLSMLYG